jgi:hypothetical protein
MGSPAAQVGDVRGLAVQGIDGDQDVLQVRDLVQNRFQARDFVGSCRVLVYAASAAAVAAATAL